MTVLRSGIPDTLPGRSLNLCERGIAAVLPGELTAGEAVGLEVRLPLVASPLRARALVRYCDRLRCGMEFTSLSSEQQAAIRDWAALAKAPTESDEYPSLGDAVSVEFKDGDSDSDVSDPHNSSEPDSPKRNPVFRASRKRRRIVWLFLAIVAIVVAVVFWWRWNRVWEEMESGLAGRPVATKEQRAQVPGEVMEKLLIHRVDPEYPEAARPGKLQGLIVLDVVVGTDGSVLQMRPLNGPEILSRAAMEALRWWKFQPYRENGQALEVETTVAVEFKDPGKGGVVESKAGRQ